MVGQWSGDGRARSGRWSPSKIGSSLSIEEAQHTPMTKVGGYSSDREIHPSSFEFSVGISDAVFKQRP
eukprot:11168780-Lingulodinium_polyedra.AAC.1